VLRAVDRVHTLVILSLRGVRPLRPYAYYIMYPIRHPFRLLRPAAFPFLCVFRNSGPTPNLNARNMSNTPLKVQKSEDEWRAVLNKEQFRILRQKGTEAAGTGEYEKHKDDGTCGHLDNLLDRGLTWNLDAGVYTCAGELRIEVYASPDRNKQLRLRNSSVQVYNQVLQRMWLAGLLRCHSRGRK
jgi:hypothetical protein